MSQLSKLSIIDEFCRRTFRLSDTPHDFTAAHAKAKCGFVRLLYDHRFFLQKIWTRVVQNTDENVTVQVEHLLETYGISKTICSICRANTSTIKHLGAAIRLCKMAGKNFQRLKLAQQNTPEGLQCDGYVLTFAHHFVEGKFAIRSYSSLEKLIKEVCGEFGIDETTLFRLLRSWDGTDDTFTAFMRAETAGLSGSAGR